MILGYDKNGFQIAGTDEECVVKFFAMFDDVRYIMIGSICIYRFQINADEIINEKRMLH